MLTHPSDPLPQIVCPMDEDAIPPNRFCSAPSLSEPPPPLPPFSSTTPSCEDDGISGHRRSGLIQEIRTRTPKKQSNADSGAAQTPPSPPKRQWESESMVQAWESKQPRVESTHENEQQSKDGSDFSYIAECQNEQNGDKPPWIKTNVSTVEGVVEQFPDDATPDLEINLSDMDACGSLAAGDAPVPKGWVIGPLFQSFKSKMASFTEIVMSPVKLFRAHSPPPSMDHPDKLDECEPQAVETSDAELSNPSDAFNLEAQIYNNQGANANQQRPSAAECPKDAKNVASNYSKDLLFEAEVSAQSSGQADECALSHKEKSKPDPVPLHHSPSRRIVSEDVSESVGPVLPPVLLQPAVDVSASHESELQVSSAKQKGKPPVQLKALPRKRTGNRKKATTNPVASDVRSKESEPEVIDEQLPPMNSVESANPSDVDKMLSLSSSVCYAQPDCHYGREMDDCHLVPQRLPDGLKNAAYGRPHVVLQQLDTYLAADLGRAKRQLNLECHSEDFVKKKRLSVDVCRMEITNVASDRGVLRGLRPQRKEGVSTNAAVDGEERPRPARKRQAVPSRSNRRKDGQEVLTALSERVLNAQTGGSCDPAVVCTPDQTKSLSEDKQKGSSKVKPSGSGKRPKTGTVLGYPNVNVDLETTIAITSTKQAAEERLPEALVRPEEKQLQSTRTCSDVNKKPRKRKSPNQASSNPDSDDAGVSASSVEPLEVVPTDGATSRQRGATGLKQPSKRTRKAVKSSAPSRSQETKQCVPSLHPISKESPSGEEDAKILTDPVYFEMTPFESDPQPPPPASQPHLDRYVQSDNAVEHLIQREEGGVASAGGEASKLSSRNSLALARPRPSERSVKPRREDRQRRKCRILHSSMCKGEEGTKSSTLDNADIAAAGTRSAESGSWRRLLRSYSCPEIPSLRSFDTPGNSAHPGRAHSLPQFPHTPFSHHAHKSLHRARRHTVSSVEVEREIAPLCLRKEVYPSRRSVPYDGGCPNRCPGLALSPSSSLSPLASRFLSSPLAFLSKKADGRGAGPGAPPTSSSIRPLNPSTWRLSGFLQRSDSPASASSSSGVSLECEIERRRRQSEEEDDGENMCSSSQGFDDVALREEKALSDSEIKVVRKHEERGKVSSIRIRKTLPKPQNNLTPMGLPKPIRLKKKEFSLEEIYTNKNFSKPPESRLETIFEVPLNRRDGSESWFGQRRLKRYLEFLEVGEVRKPKKPLVGVGKAGMSSSRTRRGGFPKRSDSVQDVDSLLCAKLDQLSLWLTHDQSDS